MSLLAPQLPKKYLLEANTYFTHLPIHIVTKIDIYTKKHKSHYITQSLARYIHLVYHISSNFTLNKN